MNTLEKKIEEIEKRNKRVELDKKWETSAIRKCLIMILTYSIILLFFVIINVEKPFINALVPTIGFFLSTLTLDYFKKIWLKKNT